MAENTNQDPRTVTGYMCRTDWKYELGAAAKGNTVYPSVADLKKNLPCWKECGIVEVEVRMKRTIWKGTI